MLAKWQIVENAQCMQACVSTLGRFGRFRKFVYLLRFEYPRLARERFEAGGVHNWCLNIIFKTLNHTLVQWQIVESAQFLQ